MPAGPLTPCPILGDGYDGSVIVQRGWMALAMYAGSNISRYAATELIRGWQHAPQLTDEERVAVLRRFPERPVPPLPPHVAGQRIGDRHDD